MNSVESTDLSVITNTSTHNFDRVFESGKGDLLKKTAKDIDAQGFACIENIISEQDLEGLRASVAVHAERHKGEYFAYHGKEKLANSPLAALWNNRNLLEFLSGLYHSASHSSPPSTTIWPVLRCVQGDQGLRESGCFHFDASLVTMLIPITIPSTGLERGDLMIFPNIRNVQGHVLLNILQKFLVQNPLSRKLINFAIRRKWLSPEQLLLKPGNIYLFWGYRSLHANKSCSPGVTRATAIFHFGDPHQGSVYTRLILQNNQARARNVSEKSESPDLR